MTPTRHIKLQSESVHNTVTAHGSDESNSLIRAIGLAAIILGLMVRPSSVNLLTSEISEILRWIFITTGAICVLYMSLWQKISKECRLAIIVFLYIFFYIHIIGLSNLQILPSYAIIFIAFSASIFAILAMNFCDGNNSQYLSAKIIVIFSLLWLFFIYLSGGVAFGIPPKINFEIYSVEGYQFDYSQGITSFFGMSSISAAYLSKANNKFFNSLIYAAISLLFFSICVSGGSRGEILMSCAIILLIINPNRKIYRFISTVILSLFLLFMLQFLITSDTDITAFNRMREVATGDSYGMRDILYANAIGIFKENFKCAAFGCGTLYFQSFYNYPYELYPHNILVEYAISSGVLIIFLLFILFLYAVLKFERKLFTFYIGLYFFLVAMKSGDIYGFWIANAFFFFLSAIGMIKIYYKRYYN